MSYKHFSAVSINGVEREFSNVNAANESVRDWGGKNFVRNRDFEFCLTFQRAPESEEELMQAIRHFKNVLRRKLLSRGDQRKAKKNPDLDLKMMGIKEGSLGGDVHFHVVMRLPNGVTFVKAKKAIVKSWRRIYGAGFKFDFRPYSDSGIIQYNAKEITPCNTDGICLELTSVKNR